MVRHREFEASEMSLSTYVVTLMQDDPPFIAIPVFPSRVFRHGSIFVSTRSGIERPADIVGKRVAAPEYQMTAPVWIRGMLSDEFGVGVESVTHFTGGVEEPGREEKLKLDLPSRIRVSSIGPKRTIAQMLADGELDAFFTARAPSTFYSRPGDVRRLFPDFVHVEQDYFRRTGIFPIMHTIVIRRDVYRAQSVDRAIALQGVRRGETQGARRSTTQTAALTVDGAVAREPDRGSPPRARRRTGGRTASRPTAGARHLPAIPPRAGPVERLLAPEHLFARETLILLQEVRRQRHVLGRRWMPRTTTAPPSRTARRSSPTGRSAPGCGRSTLKAWICATARTSATGIDYFAARRDGPVVHVKHRRRLLGKPGEGTVRLRRRRAARLGNQRRAHRLHPRAAEAPRRHRRRDPCRGRLAGAEHPDARRRPEAALRLRLVRRRPPHRDGDGPSRP